MDSNKEVELFRPQKELILRYVRKNGVKNIALYSASTSIPLMAIYTFVLEDLPEHRELAGAKLIMLKEFYK